MYLASISEQPTQKIINFFTESAVFQNINFIPATRMGWFIKPQSNQGGEKKHILAWQKNSRKDLGALQTKREEEKTTLSTHFWKEIEAGGAPTIQWKVL